MVKDMAAAGQHGKAAAIYKVAHYVANFNELINHTWTLSEDRWDYDVVTIVNAEERERAEQIEK